MGDSHENSGYLVKLDSLRGLTLETARNNVAPRVGDSLTQLWKGVGDPLLSRVTGLVRLTGLDSVGGVLYVLMAP